MIVRIFHGDAANELLADGAFRDDWTKLWKSCPWATVFQSPGFALPWYRVYAERYEPVLILGRDHRFGGLSGLFLLARRLGWHGLAHAGAHHAEYQTWLA